MLSSGNVKEEVEFMLLNGVGKVISLSDAETLGEICIFSEPPTDEPGLSAPTESVNHENDLAIVRWSLKSFGEFSLPGSGFPFLKNWGRIDGIDPLHDPSVANE